MVYIQKAWLSNIYGIKQVVKQKLKDHNFCTLRY